MGVFKYGVLILLVFLTIVCSCSKQSNSTISQIQPTLLSPSSGNQESPVSLNTIICWGRNVDGECDVPLSNEDFLDFAAGFDHSIALRQDGSIVA